MLRLALVGLSHHTAPIEVRERLSCSERHLPEALAALTHAPEIREVALLSTCNRMEVYALSEASEHTGFAQISAQLSAYHRVPEAQFASHLYRHADDAAVSHLLRVAGGLDSLALGETQILGQVRTALRIAQQAGTSGSVVQALFQQALLSGKRIQSETGLGRGAFSIGHAAVDLASHIFTDLSRATVLVLGAGKMSELTARHLVSSGVRFIVVANRTYAKAVSLAERLGGKAIHYGDFQESLVSADIVISSTAAPHPVIHRATIQPIMRRRRGKPLFLIDIAVPRDIDADVGDLDNVYLYNIDSLEAIVEEETRERAVEAVKAEAIAREETQKFLIWYRSREAVPVIALLRERLERIRQSDLDILRGKLGHLSEKEWETIETTTRAMMNRVAREPILRLKREMEDAPNGETANAARYDLLTAAREIFQLESDPPASKPDAALQDLPTEVT